MKKARNELMMFLAGLAMLIAGLFIFSQRVMVSSYFSMGFRLGGVHIASGLLIVPLIMGIVWMFASGGSFGSKLLTGIGVFIIIVGVIASTHIRLETITLYEWVLIMVLIFGGLGMLARVLIFSHDDNDYGYQSRRRSRKGSSSDTIDREIRDMKRRK